MPVDGYKQRWEIQSELGQGGQGKVFHVLDKDAVQPIDTLIQDFVEAIGVLTSGVNFQDHRKRAAETLRVTLDALMNRHQAAHAGALKVLHDPENARDPVLAEERLNREISAMQKVKHQNLVEILDANPSERWYVSRYYSGGVLSENFERFKGNFPLALAAFRGLVAGVAELHKAKMVHRDIKPDNIFIGNDGTLVLGDFGLIFFEDDGHTRLSATFENVGTRDWMPGWAHGLRVDEVRPTFDVFSLGKVLWSLISGMKTLQLWYFDKPRFDVEKLFPDSAYINLANELFKKCIVEEEADCIPSADDLLSEVDRALSRIQRGGTLLRDNIARHCGVCGIGQYTLKIKGDEGDHVQLTNFGMQPRGMASFKVFCCDHCGHVQLFSRSIDGQPPGWRQ
ncbi:MAG: protein kinase [Planctomycetaceae bacterium]|nr:protein kinase [Planctomycetaceae bacterium]